MPGVAGRSSYTIAAVSRLTGVSCHALRAWERRYGFPAPLRSPTGHRRYDADQVEMIRRIAERLRGRAAIGEVIARLRSGAIPAIAPEQPAPRAGEVVGDLVDRLGGADLLGADRLLAGLVPAQRDPAALATGTLGPALVEMGERWFRGEYAVWQERCGSQYVRGRLLELLSEARRRNPGPARTVVLGTVQGDRHEGGVLILGILLELAGWRAVVLGSDLPIRELHQAVLRWRPAALGLSFVLSRNINKRFAELAGIREVPVIVGGRSILNYQGLARRHGLVPLQGTAEATLGPLMAEVRRREDLGRA